MPTPSRRRPPRIDTERGEAIRTSSRHLEDLRRAHGRPPADVQVRSAAIPMRLTGPAVASYCTSPAALCAELAQ